MAQERIFDSVVDAVSEAFGQLSDLQARVQELEDRERLGKPGKRVSAVEAEITDLKRRIAELESRKSR